VASTSASCSDNATDFMHPTIETRCDSFAAASSTTAIVCLDETMTMLIERLLVATARRYEAEAVVRAGSVHTIADMGGVEALRTFLGPIEVTCLISDVGPVHSAMAAARALQEKRGFDGVVSAGIGGAFLDTELNVGDLVVATEVHHGDFGVERDDGFVPASELDWPFGSHTCHDGLSARLAKPGARRGDILTVTRQSASNARTADLRRTWPDVVAEAMEGIGVAAAAATRGLPMAEVRAISNMVGPRDQHPWDKPAALDRLAEAFADL